MAKLEISPPRPPLLTSKQLAVAAVFGGLSFAWRAMGLVIPIVPPFVFDLRGVFSIIGAMASGPYGAFMIAILGGIPSGFPLPDFLGQAWRLVMFTFFYKKTYYFKAPWNYITSCGAILILDFIGINFIFGPFISYVYKILPWEVFVFTSWVIPGDQWLWQISMWAAIIIGIKYAKDFVEPTWSIRRPKN
jgi:hypothetical protein